MEPLYISSKESSEGCCPSSGTRQEEREIEATEVEGEPYREPEELSAKEDPSVTEKSSMGENGRPEVTPPPSDILVLQEQSIESKEV